MTGLRRQNSPAGTRTRCLVRSAQSALARVASVTGSGEGKVTSDRAPRGRRWLRMPLLVVAMLTLQASQAQARCPPSTGLSGHQGPPGAVKHNTYRML